MRGRIRDACRDRLKEGGPEAGYWRKVLRGLEAGRIGTFHSFCLDLLRRHAVQAGLPPEFTVLDAAVAPTIRDEALRACIRRWLADGHDDLVALATELGLDAVRDGLRSLLVGRALADPGRWADLLAGRPVRPVADHLAGRGAAGAAPGVRRSLAAVPRTCWPPTSAATRPARSGGGRC